LSDISPLVFALHSRSLACLKYLVEVGTGKGLRETYQYREDEGWRVSDEVVYSNLALGVLAKVQDLEALNSLMKQTSFVLSSSDVISFIR